MDEPLKSLLSELEQFGKDNDSVTTERSGRMLNITRDTGEFLVVLIRATWLVECSKSVRPMDIPRCGLRALLEQSADL